MRLPTAVLALILIAAPAVGQETDPERPGKASLHDRINQAINDGVAWMRTQQKDDGSFGQIGGPDYANNAEVHRYPAGLTALSLLALLKCNVEPDDPVIQKGFTYLEQNHRRPDYTYDLSMMILALEARANPFKREKKRERLLELEALKKKRKRPKDLTVKLSRKDQAWMQELVTALLERHREDSGWRYGVKSLDGNPAMRGNRDLSNTQLAVLALQVAGRCRVRVPDEIFAGTLKWVLETQEQDGPEHARYDPMMEKEGYAGPKDKARGWGYLHGSSDEKESRATGSMTTAGIASVLICRRALEARKSRLLEKWMIARADAAVLDGVAWLDLHWSMRENPGNRHYRYLYFYGLERVGDLLRRNLIGRHPWYVEGAKTLLTEQKPDGKWVSRTHEPRDIISTAFALLFLDRASLAVTGE